MSTTIYADNGLRFFPLFGPEAPLPACAEASAGRHIDARSSRHASAGAAGGNTSRPTRYPAIIHSPVEAEEIVHFQHRAQRTPGDRQFFCLSGDADKQKTLISIHRIVGRRPEILWRIGISPILHKQYPSLWPLCLERASFQGEWAVKTLRLAFNH